MTSSHLRGQMRVVVMGDTGVGKTTLADTDSLPIHFRILDLPGNASWDYDKIEVDCAVVMFDVTRPRSYKNTPAWIGRLSQRFGMIPMVLVGNKIDVKPRRIKAGTVTLHRKRGIQYHEVSARMKCNLEGSFFYLAAQLKSYHHASLTSSTLQPGPVSDHVQRQLNLTLLPPEIIDLILDYCLDRTDLDHLAQPFSFQRVRHFPSRKIALLRTSRGLKERTLDRMFHLKLTLGAEHWPDHKPDEATLASFPVQYLQQARHVHFDFSQTSYKLRCSTHWFVEYLAEIWRMGNKLNTVVFFVPPGRESLPSLVQDFRITALLRPLIEVFGSTADVQWDPTDFASGIDIEGHNALEYAAKRGDEGAVRTIIRDQPSSADWIRVCRMIHVAEQDSNWGMYRLLYELADPDI